MGLIVPRLFQLVVGEPLLRAAAKIALRADNRGFFCVMVTHRIAKTDPASCELPHRDGSVLMFVTSPFVGGPFLGMHQCLRNTSIQ